MSVVQHIRFLKSKKAYLEYIDSNGETGILDGDVGHSFENDIAQLLSYLSDVAFECCT